MKSFGDYDYFRLLLYLDKSKRLIICLNFPQVAKCLYIASKKWFSFFLFLFLSYPRFQGKRTFLQREHFQRLWTKFSPIFYSETKGRHIQVNQLARPPGARHEVKIFKSHISTRYITRIFLNSARDKSGCTANSFNVAV